MKSTGCVLDWKGGTRDWSRYHHTIVNHNCVPVRGVLGEAMYFNGIDAYLDCGNDASLNITAGTIEMWMKWSGGTESLQMLLDKAEWASTSYNQGFNLVYRGDEITNRMDSAFYGNDNKKVGYAFTPVIGTWYFLYLPLVIQKT